MSNQIRVVIVDDQAMIRTGFAMILASVPEIEVVGEAADGRRAVQIIGQTRPDVVLMDVQMPVMDGIEATRQVAAGTRVIILTTFDRDDYLFDSLQAGASGFLLKNAGPELLIEAVRAVAQGHSLLSPEVTTRVISQMSTGRPPTASPLVSQLTEREMDVLRHLALGQSNTEIADTLMVSESTVKTHISNLLAKLGLRDRVQAVVFAYQHGVMN